MTGVVPGDAAVQPPAGGHAFFPLIPVQGAGRAGSVGTGAGGGDQGTGAGGCTITVEGGEA